MRGVFGLVWHSWSAVLRKLDVVLFLPWYFLRSSSVASEELRLLPRNSYEDLVERQCPIHMADLKGSFFHIWIGWAELKMYVVYLGWSIMNVT